MARPRKKNNADYFSHDNNMWSDRKMVALRNKFTLRDTLFGISCWNALWKREFWDRFWRPWGESHQEFWDWKLHSLKRYSNIWNDWALSKLITVKLWSDKLSRFVCNPFLMNVLKGKWSQKRWQKTGSSEEVDVDNEVLDDDNPSK